MKTPAESPVLHSGAPRKLIVRVQQPSDTLPFPHVRNIRNINKHSNTDVLLGIKTNSLVTTTQELRNMSL